MAFKAAKKVFYAAVITFGSYCLALLFRMILFLTTLLQGRPNVRELGIDCEVFASFFCKVFGLCHDS